MTRVVVTGVGAVSPLGVGAGTLLERWVAGRSGIASGLGRCSDFDPGDLLTVKQQRRTDRFTQLAIAASTEALAQAGLDAIDGIDRVRAACVLGTGIGGLSIVEAEHDMLRDFGPERVSALAVPRMMPNAAAGMVAMWHGLQGPAFGVVSIRRLVRIRRPTGIRQ